MGQRRTTHFVFLTRWSCTGRIFFATSFICSAGTSDNSLMLLLPRNPIYASIFFIRASSWMAVRFSCRSDAFSASSRVTRPRWIWVKGMAPAFRAARTSAIVISSGISKDSIRTVSWRFSRVEYSTRSCASLSKRGSYIEENDSIGAGGCNSREEARGSLGDALHPRGKGAIEAIAKR